MKFYIVNVFAQDKYCGNPLAVYLCEETMQYEEMKSIANEIHFSESIFISIPKNINGGYDVRIFTPDTEVPFAGHPLLGAAYVIFKIHGEKEIRINLIDGKAISIVVNNDRATMCLYSYTLGKTFPRALAAKLISVTEEEVDNCYPVQLISSGLTALAIPLKSISVLERCKVNADEFYKYIFENGKANLYPFVRQKCNIRARCFMDDPGFLEDPATGSASAALGGYLLHYGYLGERKEISYSVIQGCEMMRESRIDMNVKSINNNISISVSGMVTNIASGVWL